MYGCIYPYVRADGADRDNLLVEYLPMRYFRIPARKRPSANDYNEYVCSLRIRRQAPAVDTSESEDYNHMMQKDQNTYAVSFFYASFISGRSPQHAPRLRTTSEPEFTANLP